MISSQIDPPVPHVQYLPTILRRIETGDIRIPAFQRDFVWSKQQIVELLESMFHAYPIGSLLFWLVDQDLLKIEHDSALPFPDLQANYPLSFVLDGMQRLTSLYGAFNTSNNPAFAVAFNLEREEFHYPNPPSETDLFLADLFAPRRLLEAQSKLTLLADADRYIDRTVNLHSVFQEYLIPTVTIKDRGVQEVVEIFERINSTGTKLSSIDFIRALTWSEGFDLTARVEQINLSLDKIGFPLEQETIVKAIAVMLGRAPTAEALLTLRECPVPDLIEACVTAEQALMRTVEFLASEFKIVSPEFVPYEGQILVLASVFRSQELISDQVKSSLKSWFWSVGLSEGLRGKPDHYVGRAIEEARRLMESETNSFSFRLNLQPEAIVDRRLIRGKALSSSIAASFAMSQARSLTTGRVISSRLYMSKFSPSSFGVIIEPDELRKSMPGIQSARLLANVVVAEEEDKTISKTLPVKELILSIFDRLGDDLAIQTLESQFMSASSFRILGLGEVSNFLSMRAVAMHAFAVKLSEPSTS